MCIACAANRQSLRSQKTTFVSSLNSPRKGCPRGKKICVWTHLGLIKWKTTSKKIRNGRWTPKNKWKTTSKNKKTYKKSERWKKMKTTKKKWKKWKTTSKKMKTTSKKNLFSIPLKLRAKLSWDWLSSLWFLFFKIIFICDFAPSN